MSRLLAVQALPPAIRRHFNTLSPLELTEVRPAHPRESIIFIPEDAYRDVEAHLITYDGHHRSAPR